MSTVESVATRVTPEEIKTRLDRGEKFIFVDTRNPTAWGQSQEKLPGAIRIPADEVARHVGELARDRAIIPYCT